MGTLPSAPPDSTPKGAIKILSRRLNMPVILYADMLVYCIDVDGVVAVAVAVTVAVHPRRLVATVRPLDDYSNTYIGLTSVDSAVGTGYYKYGEYQYVCSPAQIAAFNCFGAVDHYQLFDLTADPYELYNVYNTTAPEIKEALAKKLRVWYPCKGTSCP